MRWFILSIAAAGFVACQAERELDVSLPNLPGGLSYVLSVQRRGEHRVFARELDRDPFRPPLVIPDGEDVELELWMYTSSLGALGLTPNELEAALEEPKRHLPTEGRSCFRARLRSGAVGAWEEGCHLGSELDQLEIAGRPPASSCVTFEPTMLDAGSSGSMTFAVRLDDGRVLLAHDNGLAFTLLDRVIRPLGVDPPGTVLWSQARGEDGTLYFGGSEGRLWRGVVGSTLSLTLLSIAPEPDELRAIVVSGSGGSFEVLAVTNHARWLRFDGSAWSELGRICDRGELCDAGESSLIGVEPGVSYAAHTEVAFIWSRIDGVVEKVLMPPNSTVSALVAVPGLGLVVGGDAGIFIRRGVMWESIGNPFGAGGPIYSMLRFRDGFLVGSRSGQLVQYAGAAFCSLLDIAGGPKMSVLALDGDQRVVGGGSVTNKLVILETTDPP